ncbi:MAG: hypothetical protein DRJ03_00780 [Chloroflexi bacterium]|nr:MAG: hypothetical protein DRJ03_00780 [Chloroflexota bacterium]
MRKQSHRPYATDENHMTQENELNHALDNPDLLIIAGSRLYGTSTPESDHDYRGFVVPPFEYLAGLGRFEHRVIREPDTVIYSLQRFIELLIMGDPVCYEILFAPEANIIERTAIGVALLRSRELFACKRFARRISGYAQSEWRKVAGTQLVPVKRTPNESEVVEDIRAVFHPQKEEMDEVIRLLFLQHPRETRPARRKLGAKRKAQIERYGYCTSSACHTIRLLGQLRELMQTGKLTFPRPQAKLLSMIKRGELSLDRVVELYEDAKTRADRAIENTDLPTNAPIKQIRTIYHEIVAHSIRCDQRFVDYAEGYGERWERW